MRSPSLTLWVYVSPSVFTFCFFFLLVVLHPKLRPLFLFWKQAMVSPCLGGLERAW
jgi:hypothetical protein